MTSCRHCFIIELVKMSQFLAWELYRWCDLGMKKSMRGSRENSNWKGVSGKIFVDTLRNWIGKNNIIFK